ncbi:chloride channel protein [Thiolapillus brandeum]|uniref:Chloride channel protein CIC family n=1 Tax=Thiolapillus brandeum TaxID=1076588 RepID=A0A7U6GHJ9_9GAMM|nr:chloride channel protein [Thiolapillus brandeum]BAO43724.1 chloride channel protein CIC family [Thiolapillus brandeum]
MYRKRLRQSGKHLLSRRVWRTRAVFLIGAVLVGIAASLLAMGSDWASETFLWAIDDRPWLPFVITPLGLTLIIWMTRNLFVGSEGSGIPQAIAALHLKRHKHLRHRLLSLPIAFGKGIMIVMGLLCGASIGREGPTIHIAASISFALTRFARFPHHDISRGLILAGGAAGLAAAFNTPLAGVMFAIEEMAKNFEEKTNGTVFTAVIIAGITALSINGNYAYFGTVFAEAEFPGIFSAVVLCGVVGGLIGGSFSALLVYGGRYLRPWRSRHPYLLAMAIGLLLATIGLVSGGLTWGTGYTEAKTALMGIGLDSEGYPIYKYLATLLSYWSGIPGGIFAPSLSIGAGLGVELSQWLPGVSVATVALLGMAAYFTGVVQTPLTAVIIIMEMTDNQGILLPVMVVALIADGISKLINPQPIYRALAEDFIRDLSSQHGANKAGEK